MEQFSPTENQECTPVTHAADVDPRPAGSPELFHESSDIPPYAPDAIINVTANPYCNPMSPLYDEAHYLKSQERHNGLERLFTDLAPKDVPPTLLDMVYRDFLAGAAQRNVKSIEGYDRLLARRCAEGDMSYVEGEEKFLWGEASPTEMFAFAKESHIDSCTLTFVTHFGHRLEHVYAARDAVSAAIREHGGNEFENCPSQYTKLSIQPQINSELFHQKKSQLQLDGYLAVYKRNVGEFPDNEGNMYDIIERQAIAIDLQNPSHDMDPTVYQELHPDKPQFSETEHAYDQWYQTINKHADGYFTDMIRSSIAIPDYVYPTSTTMYIARRDMRGDYAPERSEAEIREEYLASLPFHIACIQEAVERIETKSREQRSERQ